MPQEERRETVSTLDVTASSPRRAVSGCATRTAPLGRFSNNGGATESVWTTWLREHASEMDSEALACKLLRLGQYVL